MRKFSYMALAILLAISVVSLDSMRSAQSNESHDAVKKPSNRVAKVRHLMKGIVLPTAKAIFAKGQMPGSAVEWKLAAQNSAVMSEVSIMLVQNKRIREGRWKSIAKELHVSSAEAYRAAIAKDSARYEKARGRIKNSCKACHDIYRKH